MTKTSRSPRFGPVVTPEGVRFRLWAPSAAAVSLLLPDDSRRAMKAGADGFFEAFVPGVGIGQRYLFEVAGQRVPDPASRLQETDVFGWSVVCDRNVAQKTRVRPPWQEAVICEVHVGTVSPEGTFGGLAERLRYFAEAGYSVIELMPISDFRGARGWGYDGVLPFAPDRSYGNRADLHRLIDQAHELGLTVMLDVVYNHFGPAGNFLHLYAAEFFSKDERTPWGHAINFAEPMVRAFFIENALMWIEEFGFDGLRFDAVHAFLGKGSDLFLEELAAALRQAVPDVYLVLENEDNAARWLAPGDTREVAFDAQWNDDYHHVFHVLATGESAGYYADYVADPIAGAARVMAEGFLYQGQPSGNRDGEPRGEPSAHLHPACFVSFLQNHDQIGNRAFGERLVALAEPNQIAMLQFTLLLTPQIPLLFMGEEFGATTPFQYFCDFDGELADAVREGRKLEFKSFEDLTNDKTAVTPDPNAEGTFRASLLDWHSLHTKRSMVNLERFRALVNLRRQEVVPLLNGRYLGAEASRHDGAVRCRWSFEGGAITLVINPSHLPAIVPSLLRSPTTTIGNVASRDGAMTLGPWSAAFWGRDGF